jgi:hypothetical protein
LRDGIAAAERGAQACGGACVRAAPRGARMPGAARRALGMPGGASGMPAPGLREPGSVLKTECFGPGAPVRTLRTARSGPRTPSRARRALPARARTWTARSGPRCGTLQSGPRNSLRKRKRCDLLLVHAPAGGLERTDSQVGAWGLVGRVPALFGVSRPLECSPGAVRASAAQTRPGTRVGTSGLLARGARADPGAWCCSTRPPARLSAPRGRSAAAPAPYRRREAARPHPGAQIRASKRSDSARGIHSTNENATK